MFQGFMISFEDKVDVLSIKCYINISYRIVIQAFRVTEHQKGSKLNKYVVL